MRELDTPATCPNCKTPDVPIGHTTDYGLRFRRCGVCAWSWFTQLIKKDDTANDT